MMKLPVILIQKEQNVKIINNLQRGIDRFVYIPGKGGWLL